MARNSIDNPLQQDDDTKVSPEEQLRREQELEAQNNAAGDNNDNNARVIARQQAESANREVTGKTEDVNDAIYDENGRLVAKPASWENPNGEDFGDPQEVLLTFEQTKAVERAIENGEEVPDFSNQAVKRREYVPGTELAGSDENGQHRPPQAAPAVPGTVAAGNTAPPPPPPAGAGKTGSSWAPK